MAKTQVRGDAGARERAEGVGDVTRHRHGGHCTKMPMQDRRNPVALGVLHQRGPVHGAREQSRQLGLTLRGKHRVRGRQQDKVGAVERSDHA